MSATEQQINQALRSAKHSLALEGLHVTPQEEMETRLVLQGKMSIHDLIRKVKADAHV